MESLQIKLIKMFKDLEEEDEKSKLIPIMQQMPL